MGLLRSSQRLVWIYIDSRLLPFVTITLPAYLSLPDFMAIVDAASVTWIGHRITLWVFPSLYEQLLEFDMWLQLKFYSMLRYPTMLWVQSMCPNIQWHTDLPLVPGDYLYMYLQPADLTYLQGHGMSFVVLLKHSISLGGKTASRGSCPRSDDHRERRELLEGIVPDA